MGKYVLYIEGKVEDYTEAIHAEKALDFFDEKWGIYKGDTGLWRLGLVDDWDNLQGDNVTW
jgi:hypothetical protein